MAMKTCDFCSRDQGYKDCERALEIWDIYTWMTLTGKPATFQLRQSAQRATY